MKVRNVIIAVFCFATLLIQDGVAQKKRELEYSGFFDSYYFRGPVAITLGGGLVGYNGELSGGFPSKPLGNVFSLGANYKVWPRTVFGAELSYFTLKGKDSTSNINGSFTSTNFELDLYSRFYFLDDIVRVAADRSRKPRRLKPYATLGVGFVYYNAKATFGALASDTALVVIDSTGAPVQAGTSSGTANATGLTVVIPAGLGLSYSFSHRVSLMGEFTYKYSFSDMLDGTNAVPSALKDGYYMFQLKLQLAPWAPKVKRKKKYKGQAPADNGGGGTESPNAPSEKPKAEETPADGKETPAETPVQETPAQEVPEPTETPAKETPVQEGDGWDQPQKSNKPAAK